MIAYVTDQHCVIIHHNEIKFFLLRYWMPYHLEIFIHVVLTAWLNVGSASVKEWWLLVESPWSQWLKPNHLIGCAEWKLCYSSLKNLVPPSFRFPSEWMESGWQSHRTADSEQSHGFTELAKVELNSFMCYNENSSASWLTKQRMLSYSQAL